MKKIGATYCTAEIDTSEIIVDFLSGISQWMFSGIYQHNFTFQWYIFQRVVTFSSGFVLEFPHGFSVPSSEGTSLL